VTPDYSRISPISDDLEKDIAVHRAYGGLHRLDLGAAGGRLHRRADRRRARVAELADEDFRGEGVVSTGVYALTLIAQPPSIGSISGGLVDAVTREPLPGEGALAPEILLERCTGSSCFEIVARTRADAGGSFRFEIGRANLRIEPGEFRVTATAEEYAAVTTRIAVDADADADLGELALVPPPFMFVDARPCAPLGPEGGRCEYSVVVRSSSAANPRLSSTPCAASSCSASSTASPRPTRLRSDAQKA